MRNPYYQGPPAANFDGLRFFNPGEPETDRSLRQLLQWKFGGAAATWPKHVPVEQAVPDARVEGLRVTMVGHATLLIQAAGLNILTDPVWSERASPLPFAGPKRVTAPGIEFDHLPPVDAILLSHNHYDHFDIATLRRLNERDRPTIVTLLGNDAIVRKHIRSARINVGNWGASFALADDATVYLLPANHWSSRSLRDRRMALWGGFMLMTTAGSVYFAGDTGYGSGRIFRDIREHYGAPDVALIPIGAYEPRWFMSAQHCSPEEAVQIMLDVGAKRSVGIHWGTFQLTDEPRCEPAERLASALAEKGLETDAFVAGRPGDCWSFG